MVVYEFKCRECGKKEESHTPVLGDARSLCCEAELLRVWQANIGTVPGGYKDSNRGG